MSILTPYRTLLAGVASCTVLLALSSVLYAWVLGMATAALFDTGANAEPAPKIPTFLQTWQELAPQAQVGITVCILLGTAAVRATASFTQMQLLARLEQTVGLQLRSSMYDQVLHLDPAVAQQQQSGELSARMSGDLAQVQGLLRLAAPAFFRSTLSGAAAAAFALYLDPLLGGLALLALPLAYVALRALSKHNLELHRARAHHEGHLAAVTGETLTNQTLIRSYQAESFFKQRFVEGAETASRLGLKAARTRAKVGPAVELLSAAALAAAILIAHARLASSPATAATYAALFGCLLILYRAIQSTLTATANVAAASGAVGRIDQLMGLKREPTSPAASATPAAFKDSIELRNVSFRYGDGPWVLREISLALRAGERLVIVGRSGEGKSTLLRLLSGLVQPVEGQLHVDGVAVIPERANAYRQLFAWVDQEPALFTSTVLENVALGDASPDRLRAREAARVAGAEKFIDSLPDGFDQSLPERGTSLSMGQRQRLCIARALYRRAPLLVLDEPTASLDERTEAELGVTLDELVRSENRTVVVATHRASTAAQADRIIELSGGRTRERLPSELRTLLAPSSAQPQEP